MNVLRRADRQPGVLGLDLVALDRRQLGEQVERRLERPVEVGAEPVGAPVDARQVVRAAPADRARDLRHERPCERGRAHRHLPARLHVEAAVDEQLGQLGVLGSATAAASSSVTFARVDAVVLALASAFLFGAMTVALRFALARVPDAEAGALLTIVAALAVTLPFVVAGDVELGGVWPFLLAGMLGPGLSQLLFTFAMRDAGPSRTSVIVGTAPLFSVAIALVFLDEPREAGVLVGALLIVVGGVLLVPSPAGPST